MPQLKPALIVGLALAGLASGMMTFGALALDLDIANTSKTPIHHIYLSAVGEKNWGDDELGDEDDDTIEPGASYTVTDIEAGKYDLKLVASDGTACIVPNVRFGTDKVWTITEAMLDNCNNN